MINNLAIIFSGSGHSDGSVTKQEVTGARLCYVDYSLSFIMDSWYNYNVEMNEPHPQTIEQNE